ncbi:enoyl-[acyl-carrier-protein] reductase FabV, partial [Streptomyces prunicolor]
MPRIALYVGPLRGALGERLISPAGQLAELWDQLTGTADLVLDDEGRVRLDTRELSDDVQTQT